MNLSKSVRNDENWETLKSWFVEYQSCEAEKVRPLFENLHQKITVSLRKKGLRSEDVDDLSQVILLKIHMHHESYNPSYSLRGWVVTIVERSVIDFWRSGKGRKFESWNDDDLTHSSVDMSNNWKEQPDQALESKEVLECTKNLKPLDKKIFDLYALEGQSIKDIGKKLDLSPGAVKVRIHRARKHLKATYLLFFLFFLL